MVDEKRDIKFHWPKLMFLICRSRAVTEMLEKNYKIHCSLNEIVSTLVVVLYQCQNTRIHHELEVESVCNLRCCYLNLSGHENKSALHA